MNSRQPTLLVAWLDIHKLMYGNVWSAGRHAEHYSISHQGDDHPFRANNITPIVLKSSLFHCVYEQFEIECSRRVGAVANDKCLT
ncbi:hypothetical protein D9M71_793230 [compost metagenome]